jgi:predicted PurR-regulated permease PerM
MAFGQLMGFVGVLIALPASAVLLVALRRLRLRYLSSGLYQQHPTDAHQAGTDSA